MHCRRNSRGAGQWSAVQVSRALERLPSCRAPGPSFRFCASSRPPAGPLVGTPGPGNSYLPAGTSVITARSHTSFGSMGGSHGSSGSHSCHRLYRCCTHLLLCHRPRVAAAAYLRRGFLAQRRLVARPGPLALIEGAASRMSLPSKPSLWKLRTAPHDLSANRQLDRSVWSSASNPLRGYPLGCCVAATLV